MKISNLRKTFGRFSLHIEELELESGKIYGLVGPNGSGKSTAIKLLSGLMKPDAGEIDYGDCKPNEITIVPQKPYVMRDTVLANLVYPLKLRKIKPDMHIVDQYLELAGLQDMRKAYAPGLSSGETSKLALIRAMIFSPKVIFLDETFANMDEESRVAFEEFILDRQKVSPIMWVIVSHQLPTIRRMCDFVFAMCDGRVDSVCHCGS